MKEFIGTGVALVTPFKSDKRVDVEALQNIVQFQISNGVDYLVVLGTTAESATLTEEEKKTVIETVVTENNGRLPLVLGVGGNDTEGICKTLKETDLTAFNAILSVSPYYNKPTQQGILQHYKRIAEESPLPIILYNVPGRTASNILPETVKQLADECSNIIGIKEAAGDIVQAMNLISLVPEGFLVISGDDMIALPMVLAGGHGVISVIGQAYPAEFVAMIGYGLNRKVDAAYKIHYSLAESMQLIFAEGNPTGIKVLLEKRGFCERTVRLPLVEATSGLVDEIGKFSDRFLLVPVTN